MQKILDLLPHIPDKRKYWFVRTNAGQYYKHFFEGNYIGISWNEIAISDTKKSLKDLCSKVKEVYKNKKRPTLIAKQILNFSNKIKKGDIVLIPNKKSTKITFGEVLEDNVYIHKVDNSTKKDCPYTKRKKVKWLKTVKRNDLDPHIYKLIYFHHTVTDATCFAPYIEKTINSFFIKGDNAHLILNAKTNQGINAKDLFSMGLNILKIIDEFNLVTDSHLSSNDIEVKINLQSKGKIELKGSIYAILVLGIITTTLTGGHFETNNKIIPFKFETNSIIDKINHYQKQSHIRNKQNEFVKAYLEEFEIQSPAELNELLKTISAESKEQ